MMEQASENNIEEEVARAFDQAKELQDSAASFLSKTFTDEQSLRQRALSLESNIRRLRSLLTTSGEFFDPKLADKLEEELQRARCVLVDSDAAAFLPGKSQEEFLRMFLGPINVRASRKDIQLKVKEEYNSYRVLYFSLKS